MTLATGTRLGSYELVGVLGAGGMGEVYRARDTRLRRDVAIKVITEALSTDPDRVARFRREAQALASLNHPNIAAIYGLEESGSALAIVMELVEGSTLADRIARGAVPVEESLAVARQIAEALETAHDQGIIHRDLKPANITVRDDGTVKVLDFGLAKLADPPVVAADGSAGLTRSPTITSPAMTAAGILLGTAAYMSPEQAKGRAVDRRADVWAFGCVLYEMLTGRRAFEAEDISETLAFVLTRTPDWSALPPATPVRIRNLLRRCLEKDPRKRLPHVGVARLEIDEAQTDEGDEHRFDPKVGGTAARRRTFLVGALAVSASVVAVAATAAIVWRMRPAAGPSPGVVRFAVPLLEGQRLASLGRGSIAMSPDGTQLAYLANTGLFVRKLADDEAKLISSGVVGTVADLSALPSNLVFSPEGDSVLFYATLDSSLKRISLEGGPPVTMARLTGPPSGLSWNDSGILFAYGSDGIFKVAGDGSPPVRLIGVEAGEQAFGPQLLPGGEWVLFTLASGVSADRWDLARIVVESLKTGVRTTILEGGSDARYLPTGHLVYAVGGVLYAVGFDLDQLKTVGNAVPAIEGIARASGASTGIAHFSVSASGNLIYVPGSPSAVFASLRLVRIDRQGTVHPFPVTAGPYEFPRVSPDGTRAAVGVSGAKDTSIWIFDLTGNNSGRRLTPPGRSRFPAWSPDGQWVAFQSDRDGGLGIFRLRADGSSPVPDPLTKPGPGESHVPEAWSKDDQLLFGVAKGDDITLSILAIRDKTVTPFSDIRSQIPTSAVLSPNGRWIAYQGGVRGDNGIYVQPFPGPGARYQISRANAHHPAWSPDGQRLFYIPARSQPVSVGIRTAPSFGFTEPVVLPGAKWLEGGPVTERTYDVMPDGDILGLSDPLLQSENVQIEVVLNWFTELQQRVPRR